MEACSRMEKKTAAGKMVFKQDSYAKTDNYSALLWKNSKKETNPGFPIH